MKIGILTLVAVFVAAADGAAHDAAARQSGHEHKQERKQKRKILYYRNPMGLPDTSPTPKKDPMGMDYIPVYAGDEEDGAAIKISLDRVQRSGVRAETVRERRLVRPVRAPGIVKFDERRLRSVTLRADAFIEKLYVNETGREVVEGEPLFRVYSQQIVSAQVDYRSSTAVPSVTREEAARARRGAARRLRNLDVPEPVIAALEAGGGMKMSIDWPSPATGAVIEKKVIEGQQIKTGEEAMRIANLDTVWIIARVAEHDLGLIKVGAPAALAFHAFPDMRVKGEVTFMAPMLDASSRTGLVRIEAANPGHVLRAEMYADVEIDAGADQQPLLAAPDSSIIDSGARQIVLVERGEGRFEPRPVKLGLRGDGYVEIKKGLKPGERVVVSANFLIDAESNLKAALKSFTAGAPGPARRDAPARGGESEARQ
jgi:Cu(I)/Ag(I) efflux system membrane fusion protein